jgi:hypothetical protein
MKHLKKFNESKEEDIFTDESLLHDILLEYAECNLTYKIKYKAFSLYENEYFMPVGDLPKGFGTIKQNLNRGFQISFSEIFKDGYSATDVQRGENQRFFGKPNNNLYKFFEITKDVQYRIESMGYIFLLSTHKNGEFDFMIIENK